MVPVLHSCIPFYHLLPSHLPACHHHHTTTTFYLPYACRAFYFLCTYLCFAFGTLRTCLPYPTLPASRTPAAFLRARLIAAHTHLPPHPVLPCSIKTRTGWTPLLLLCHMLYATFMPAAFCYHSITHFVFAFLTF